MINFLIRIAVQVIVLLIAYVWSITPIMNLLTYVFDSPSLGFLVTSVIGALTGEFYIFNSSNVGEF